MAKSSAQAVKELRDMTGLGMMDCKRILDEAGDDLAKAKDLARTRGQEKLAKVAGRAASEGIVHSYIHHNNRVGVLLELNCNTDFVARNEDFVGLARDLAMHVAAMRPLVVNREDLDQELVAGVRQHHASEIPPNKPAEIVEKIVDGKMRNWYEERVLMDQKFAKDEGKTIRQLVEEVAGTTKENVTVRRFARFEVGEESLPEG